MNRTTPRKSWKHSYKQANLKNKSFAVYISRDVPLKRVYTGVAQTGRRMRILAAYFGLRGRVYNLRRNGMDSRAIHSTPENHPTENGSSTRGCLPIEPSRADSRTVHLRCNCCFPSNENFRGMDPTELNRYLKNSSVYTSLLLLATLRVCYGYEIIGVGV